VRVLGSAVVSGSLLERRHSLQVCAPIVLIYFVSSLLVSEFLGE